MYRQADGGGQAVGAADDAVVALVDRQQVGFVVDQQLRDCFGTDLCKYGVDVVDLAQMIGIGGIDDVQQHIGQRGFFEGGGKGGYQPVRQVAHEADGVGENQAGFGGEVEPPRGGVECGEELVLREDVGFGQAVEQAGFAGVGVADDGKGFQAA